MSQFDTCSREFGESLRKMADKLAEQKKNAKPANGIEIKIAMQDPLAGAEVVEDAEGTEKAPPK